MRLKVFFVRGTVGKERNDREVISVCVCVCVCVCIYIYIYIYTHTYTQTYDYYKLFSLTPYLKHLSFLDYNFIIWLAYF